MVIWKTLVDQCLQCMKWSTKQVEKENAVAMVRTNSDCKKKCSSPYATEISMIVSSFITLPHCTWDIFATGNASSMEVNTEWKSLRLSIFINLKRPLNWLKNKIQNIEENWNETLKHFVSFVSFQFSHFIRSWEKCPLLRGIRYKGCPL